MKNNNFMKSSGLGGFSFSIAVFSHALFWDLALRFRSFINRRKTYKSYIRFFQDKCERLCNMLSFFSGLKFEIEIPDNLILPENFIIISNHQSLADIIIIGNSFKNHNIKFIAKKSLKYKVPLISIYLRAGKHAFVSAGTNFKETIKEMQNLAALTKVDKVCPVIFPEGTRSKDGKLGEFHSAAVKLICRLTDLPVVSVALDGGFNFSNIHSFINASSDISYKLKVMSIYPKPKGKTEVNNLMRDIKEEINTQLTAWRN